MSLGRWWVLVFGLGLVGAGCQAAPDNDAVSRTQTVYLAADGDDTASGLSPEDAFATLRRALEAAAGGGQILVQPGTYHEAVSADAVGGPENPVTIIGQGIGVLFDGYQELAIGFWCTNCQSIHLENIHFQNYTDIGVGFLESREVTLVALTIESNGHSVQMVDWDLEGYGLFIESSSLVRIEDCELSDNGPKPPQAGNSLLGTGINLYGCEDCLVRGNRVHHNQGGGVLVEDSFQVRVESNEIFANDLDASAEGWWDGGIWVDGGRDVAVIGNHIYDNLGPGIEISDEDNQQPEGYTVTGNIVQGNYYGLFIWNFGSADYPPEHVLHIEDNDVANNTRQDVWIVDWLCPPEEVPCD